MDIAFETAVVTAAIGLDIVLAKVDAACERYGGTTLEIALDKSLRCSPTIVYLGIGRRQGNLIRNIYE